MPLHPARSSACVSFSPRGPHPSPELPQPPCFPDHSEGRLPVSLPGQEGPSREGTRPAHSCPQCPAQGLAGPVPAEDGTGCLVGRAPPCLPVSVFSNAGDSEQPFHSSFPCLILHFVDGGRCPVATDNSCDLFDSTLAVTPRSGTKLKSG